jgi:hypothetical protein
MAVAGCAALVGMGWMTTGLAAAAGSGLPRTYDVARYDSPSPAATAQYPLGLANAGDLNGDGKEDFITSQLANTRNDAGAIVANGNGAIFIISGATGERIKTIESPDLGGTGNAANFAFPWASKVGTNRSAAPTFTDLGSCSSPPPNAGELCRSATVGAPDGVPDILVGARGVDARGLRDSGRVYVFDGATFSLLKRIDQPESDTTPVALSRAGGSWFGRVVLNPAGLPPCEGNAGVGSCETVSAAVAKGDVDGGGVADLVISASATTENSASAHPNSHCARTPGATCGAAGRVYVYRGEDIVGSPTSEILDGTVGPAGGREEVTRIRNPHAQADTTNQTNADSEIFANSLIPIGDVGACRTVPATATAPSVPPPPAGEFCPRANGTTTPDGKPEWVIGAPRNDLPLDAPDPTLGDAGAAYLVDGATSTILQVWRHPEAHLGATFGQMTSAYAPGDLGDTGLPDVFIPAAAQSIPGFSNAGRGYVMNGNFQTSVNLVNFARLNDPTPRTFGRFGSSSTGVGDLVPGADTPANELLVGASSSSRIAGGGDVHFFNAATERVLQTIADPDDQPASSFGGDIIPMGDLNGDAFLDFAASAPLYDSPEFTDQGRVYVFRSNDSPLPAAPTPAPPAPAEAATTPPPLAPLAPAVAAPPAAVSDSVTARELRDGRCANDMVGSDDDERLLGTTAGDAIFGRGGDDFVGALRGDDCVDAGRQDDNVSGGPGNDSLLGGADDDRMRGDSGADRVFGQDGRDLLDGDAGRDMLAGGDGNDKLRGNGDRDRLFGERGNDRLYAGGASGNLLDGGSGNDFLWARNRRRDTVRCGTGRDRAVVDRIDRVSGCERVTPRRK